MKKIAGLLSLLIAGCMFYACDNGLDSITEVVPGADESAPQVTINYPSEGTRIKVLEAVTSITIDFMVTDDIEVASVDVLIDGAKIKTYNQFKDYRRVIVDNLVYDKLADGTHELVITAKDLDNKTTSASVNFEKEPAYTPIYAGETLYMPFDGDYIDLISIAAATKVGSPEFAGEGKVGLNAYKGASDSYLTMPTEGMLGPEFSAVFWFNVNADPNRGGILVVSPPDPAHPDAPNNRTSGFRFFREDAAGMQRFKLNIGTGAGESWFDGGEAADLPPDAGWTHMAFTISGSHAVVYINGEIVSEGDFPGVSWAECNLLSIMSGAPRFTEWGHLSDLSSMDELRLFNRTLTQEEIQGIIARESGTASGYVPEFDGEMFYMPFDGDNNELFTDMEATEVGTTGFAGESVDGDDAFAGAADAYLTFPTNGLTTDEFSATFWYKLNADPDRAGILVMGPEDTERPEYPDVQNLRTSGFRFFREGDATNQVFKLNVGDGAGEAWFDGGPAASLDPSTAAWAHMAFTISGSHAVVYINGEIVSEGDFAGIDWSGCDLLSIGSGVPRFTEWGHLSDLSYLDELRLYNKALTQAEIQNIMNSDL